jgi:hypothetical protein
LNYRTSGDCQSASKFGSDSILMKFGTLRGVGSQGINAMQQAIRLSTLVPLGLVVENATCDGATTVITVRRSSRSSPCPGCGTSSERLPSRYLRRIADLPLAGRPVRLVVVARRFRCGADQCGRRIFTERFEDGVLTPWARRTGRLDYAFHHLGLALGVRPAASFARRLMLPVSNDTLLRVVRKHSSPSFAPPFVVGIDDWAWRRRAASLLPSRGPNFGPSAPLSRPRPREGAGPDEIQILRFPGCPVGNIHYQNGSRF